MNQHYINLITFLFGISSTIGVSFHIPQIWKLYKDTEARKSLSLISWTAWAFLGIFPFMYSIFVKKDYLMTTFCVLTMFCQIVIASFGYKELIKSKKEKKLATIKIEC